MSFPDYNSDSSALVKMYLRGDFGQSVTDVGPFAALSLIHICLCVDSSRQCTDVITENLKACGFFKKSRVVCMDVFSFLVAKGDKFDIIVLDPPYRMEDPTALAAAAAGRLADGGALAFESSVDNPPAQEVDGLRLYRRYRYGKTFVTVYEKDRGEEA